MIVNKYIAWTHAVVDNHAKKQVKFNLKHDKFKTVQQQFIL